MASKVIITNNNAEALDVVKYKQYTSVQVPGKVGSTPGSVEIDCSVVAWMNETEQKNHYVNTYGSLPGITVAVDADSDPTGAISITVLDLADTAIEGAGITYTGLAEPILTNAQGVASFASLEAGTYALEISKTGYTTKTVSVVLAADGSAKVNVTLVPSAAGAISFKVVDAANAAVDDATITVTGQDPVTTANGGLADFTGLTAGTYEFTIAKATYNNTVVSLILDNDTSTMYIQAVLVASGG